MTSSPIAAFRFRMERWLQRGLLFQLLVMAALVVLVAVSGGLLAWLGTEQFPHAWDGIWWAFLRLTDPGYLGDDEGAYLRVVSTTVTILGYVLFMGSLIAVMTQWLTRRMRLLESGLTPITMRGHIVILGYTNRTPELIARVLRSRGRLTRFLEAHGASRLRIVVLAESVDAALRLELREYLGDAWREDQIFLRSGTAMQPDDLRRLDVRRAAAVIVPGADFALGGSEMTDSRAVKVLLTLRQLFEGLEDPPEVVAEVLDPAKVPIVELTLESSLEVVASDDAVGRLISQSVRHERLSRVLLALVERHDEWAIYGRSHPALEGAHPLACNFDGVLPNSVAIGVVRTEGDRYRAILNPGPDLRLRADDLVLFLAAQYADCVPTRTTDLPDRPEHTSETRRSATVTERTLRVLVLGYGLKLGALLIEFGECEHETFDVTIVSKVSSAERTAWLERFDLPEERVRIRHVTGDYGLPRTLRSMKLSAYDHVVFLASSTMSSMEQADARTVLGAVMLRSLLDDLPQAERPSVTVELIDPDNARLFLQDEGMMLVSPHVSSHLLAHVALRPQLNCVYTALLSSEGPEISLRTPEDLGGTRWNYEDLQRAAYARGEIVLGLLAPLGGSTPLLPFDRSAALVFSDDDRIVVLSS